MILWDFSPILLQVFCGMVGGLSSYLLLNWAYRRMTLDHEYRLSDLEGRVNREVKIRAQQASVGSKNWEKELLQKIQTPETAPKKMGLMDWRKSQFKRGAEDGTVQKG